MCTHMFFQKIQQSFLFEDMKDRERIFWHFYSSYHANSCMIFYNAHM